MNTADIRLLYEYNIWANERILDAAEKVTDEQLARPNALGWDDLRGALTHILDAECGWFNFLFDRGDGQWLKAEDFPDLATIRARWGRQNEITRDCLENMDDHGLEAVHASERGGRRYEWLRWHALLHVVNHGTQHRSECAALLTGFDQSPGDVDFTQFLYERYGNSDFPPGDGKQITRAVIDLLINYSDWANDRILDHAARLTPEQLRAPSDLGWGSVCGTLVHLMDAEYAWRELLKEGVFVDEMQPESFPDVAAIRAHWAGEREALWRYLASLDDADLVSVISYEADGEMRRRLLWQCLWHLVNHGTQHRAECGAQLTGFAHSPGDLDFSVYLVEVGLA